MHVDGEHLHSCYLAECLDRPSRYEFTEVLASLPDGVGDVQDEPNALSVVFYFD